ncbi:tetratricopeptide repeat protein [Streptomyces sp. NPDC046870]|uniref:tetratricopeptide repeat protein n=1 Tax=Streptomyces sp. NPDC046870 TaxID=3155135 RepID=UPI003456ABE6
MTRCNRAGCGRGEIDESGFCTECDREPLPPDRAGAAGLGDDGPGPARAAGGSSASGSLGAEEKKAAGAGPGAAGGGGGTSAAAGAGITRATARAGTRSAVAGVRASGASVGVAPVRPDPWYGLELIAPGPVPDLPGRPFPGAGPVAEEHRYCPSPACGRPVGRGRDGEPGRIAGYCAHCGTRYDFAQPRGLTIAGRYAVERVLGSGAYGAAYLAHDRNLETPVVLKALNRSVAATAEHERDVLVGLRHDSIVRILGYEPEGPHLVLEYVPGEPLSARDGDRLETLLGHGIRVLQALDYLHARGLLHCDVKPLNIIRHREEGAGGPLDRVRLIDFGAVRSRDKDTGPVVAYTRAYAPPEGETEHVRPTPGFDLYGLGMTLREVCRAHGVDRAAPGVDSLMLLLDRATDVDVPRRRFVSARQFGEQLSGVIRQIVAASPTGLQVSRPSALFGSMTEPLHGGLGAARPLAHWVRATAGEDARLSMEAAFGAPHALDIAGALPVPLSDPDDPVSDAAGSALAASRLALRRRDLDAAARAFARAGLPGWHWLHSWYAGLIALAGGDAAGATGHFTNVRRTLPGELVPQLALGLCAELRGGPEDLETARSHYGTVFATTPVLGAAGFGLARMHLLAGRRASAVATAERLAQEFRHEREARIAAVRLLVTVLAPRAAAPSADDLALAREAVAGLDVDEAAAAALRAEIEYARFLNGGDRLELSEAVRALAAHAPTERDYVALVDLANRLRPPLRWPRMGRRGAGRATRSGRSFNTLDS